MAKAEEYGGQGRASTAQGNVVSATRLRVVASNQGSRRSDYNGDHTLWKVTEPTLARIIVRGFGRK